VLSRRISPMAKSSDKVSIVAVIEGRLRESQKDKVLLDISDGVAIELPTEYVAKVEEITDTETQRNFVRVQVNEAKGTGEVVLRIVPRMLSILKESRGIPLPFLSGRGMAFGATGVMPTGPESELIGGDVPGAHSPVLPLGSWHGGKTTCMWSTCTESTVSGWSVQCDKSAGDITSDDPVEVEPL
jgi:hypothetical protein